MNPNNSQNSDSPSKLALVAGSARSSFYYPLFELMDREHGIILTETELAEIVHVSEKLSESRELLRKLADCYFLHKNAGMMELMMRADRLLGLQNDPAQTPEGRSPGGCL